MENASKKEHSDDQPQRQAFHSLHEFAIRICTRYTAIENDPEKPMYTGFARFFREWHYLKFKNFTFLKNRLRDILISACIETEIKDGNFKQKPVDCPSQNATPALSINSLALSDKDIIDILRTIPFSFRVIYNMSVIDGFNEKEISSKLHISHCAVKSRLHLARKQLHKLILQSSVQQQTFAKL